MGQQDPEKEHFLVFRSMRMDDIPEVCDIEREAFPTPWSANAFVNELSTNHWAHYIVLEYDGVLAGYGGMWTIMDEAHITNIAIRADYRGLRLGDRLMRELAELARQLGMKHLTLEVRPSNARARKLYAKHGFYDVGRRKGYYSDNGEDAIVMWADI